MKYEYMSIRLDMLNLANLNALAAVGWKVVAVTQQNEPVSLKPGDFGFVPTQYALLERWLSIEGSGTLEEIGIVVTSNAGSGFNG